MKKVLLLLLLFSNVITFCQTKEYSGIVKTKGDNLPLPGVNVIIKGTKIGTQTDFDGNFNISVPDSLNILSFSFLGMVSKEIVLTEKKNLKVFLVEDNTKMEILPTHRNLWFTVGTYSDITKAPLGISIGNGIEEENHLHFEDHTHLITYNFYYAKNIENKNHTYGGKIRLTYIRGLRENSSFLQPTLEYSNKDYTNIKFENFTLSSNVYYLKSINLILSAKIGYQKLNLEKNYGIEIGMNRFKYGNYNLGINVGYWNNYFTYEPYITKFIYKKKILANLKYQRINENNFVTLGINYLFSVRKKINRK